MSRCNLNYQNAESTHKEKVLYFLPGTVVENAVILYCNIDCNEVIFKNCIIKGTVIYGVHKFVNCNMNGNMFPSQVMPGD